MQITIGGAYAYDVVISTNELYDDKGKPAAGLSSWNDHRIYISGLLPLDRREETLYHEVVECWRFHGGEPADKEDRIDWQAMIRKAFERDFAAGGGLQALLAMQPSIEVPSRFKPVADRLSILRAYRFSDLTDVQFEIARALWEARGLDPWAEHFHVRLVFDPQRRQQTIKLVMNIVGIRSLAHASQQYAGCDQEQFVYGDDPQLPESCIFTAYRLVRGERQPFTGESKWAWGRDPEKWPEAVASAPHACLAARAEAAALRRAFPDEVRDIYAPEEFIGRRAAKTMPQSIQLGMPAAGEDDIGEIPQTSQGLHLRLLDLGFKTEAERRGVISEVDRRGGEDDSSYFAKVLRNATIRLRAAHAVSSGTQTE